MNKMEYIEIIESIVRPLRELIIKIDMVNKSYKSELPKKMVEYTDLLARAAEDTKIKLLLFREIVGDD